MYKRQTLSFAHIFALPNYKETTKATMKTENPLNYEVWKISEENNVTQQQRTVSGKVVDENGEPLALSLIHI